MQTINILGIQRISARDRAKLEAADPDIRYVDAGGWFDGEYRETWPAYAVARYLSPKSMGQGTREERDRLLAEADVMRRVMPPTEYAAWLRAFLPAFSSLHPEIVTDPSDPKLAHLDGLNLSRAWMLEGIASGLPKSDPRVPLIRRIAAAHRDAGLASVTGEHYEGGHWLGSFAVYLTTERGMGK